MQQGSVHSFGWLIRKEYHYGKKYIFNPNPKLSGTGALLQLLILPALESCDKRSNRLYGWHGRLDGCRQLFKRIQRVVASSSPGCIRLGESTDIGNKCVCDCDIHQNLATWKVGSSACFPSWISWIRSTHLCCVHFRCCDACSRRFATCHGTLWRIRCCFHSDVYNRCDDPLLNVSGSANKSCKTNRIHDLE